MIAPNLLNGGVEEEWTNPNAPPHTDDISEGLKWLEDGLPQDEIDKIKSQIEEEMSAKANDPREQNYFMRVDTKTVIKTEKEYLHCQSRGIGMKIVSYAFARSLLAEEDARRRQQRKDKKKKKTAKAARRRNR